MEQPIRSLQANRQSDFQPCCGGTDFGHGTGPVSIGGKPIDITVAGRRGELALPQSDHDGVSPDSRLAPPLVLVLTAVAFTALAQGGVFERTHLITGALLAVAVAVAATRGELTLKHSRSPVILAAGAIACWAAVRAAIAGDLGLGWGTATLLIGVAAVYAVTGAVAPLARDHLASGLLATGVLLAVSGWVGVVLRSEPLALVSAGVWRAATTVTYTNAAAAILVCLALVATGRLVARPTRTGSMATMLLMVGAAATLSRAGVVALAVGLVVLALGVGARRLATTLIAPVAGAIIALAALLPSVPVDAPARPLLAIAGLAIGTCTTVMLAMREPVGGRTLVAGSVLAVIVGVTVVASVDLSDRLSLVPSDRLERNQAALEMYGDSPVIGRGPGPLWLTWQDPSGRTVGAWHVHNEYVQVLVQFGAVGGLLVAALLVAAIGAVRRGRAAASEPAAWWGIVAGLTALAVHSGFDFLWHIPAIPLLGAALAAAAAQSTNEEEVPHG